VGRRGTAEGCGPSGGGVLPLPRPPPRPPSGGGGGDVSGVPLQRGARIEAHEWGPVAHEHAAQGPQLGRERRAGLGEVVGLPPVVAAGHVGRTRGSRGEGVALARSCGAPERRSDAERESQRGTGAAAAAARPRQPRSRPLALLPPGPPSSPPCCCGGASGGSASSGSPSGRRYSRKSAAGGSTPARASCSGVARRDVRM